jgi:hypothetical protein
MKYLSVPPGTVVIPGWLTLAVSAILSIGLGVALFVLDVLGYHSDPVLATAFQLSLGSTSVLLGVSHQANVQKVSVPYEVSSSANLSAPTVRPPSGR